MLWEGTVRGYIPRKEKCELEMDKNTQVGKSSVAWSKSPVRLNYSRSINSSVSKRDPI